MKILFQHDTPAGPYFVRVGLARVLAAMGHQVAFWSPEGKSPLDIFAEFKPTIFVGQSYNLSRGLCKAIARHPECKVVLYASAWGEMVDNLDRERFPMVYVSEQEKRTVEALKKATGKPDLVWLHLAKRYVQSVLGGWKQIGCQPIGLLNGADVFVYLHGQYREEFACAVGVVSGYWKFKAQNIDPYLMPLLERGSGLHCKVWGNNPGWPTHCYLGVVDELDVKDIFASATVCPNISEPHSTASELGFDITERTYKVLASGGMVISDYVRSMQEDVFTHGEVPCADSPAGFHALVRHFVNHPDERLPHMKAGREKVLREHTYHNRISQLMRELGLPEEAARADALHAGLLKEVGLEA